MDPEDRQPSPKAKASKHEKLPCKHTLQLQPADESDTAREEAMPAAPAQKSAQGTRKQNKPEKAAKVGSKTHTKEPDNSRDKHEDVPATCNNMPVKIQPKKVPQKKHPSAQLEDRHSEDSQLASSADAQQHRHHHRNEKKRQAGKAMKNALDYMADSESEPDDYIPTQFRAAAGMAAQKPASKKIAAVQSKPTGRAKQPVQEKVRIAGMSS